MSMMSDWLEQQLINHILRNQAAPTFGASVYVALFTSDPTDAASGTEATGGSWARKAVTRGTGQWDAPASRATQNTSAITMDAYTGASITVTHWGIFDASTTGNLIFHGALTNSKTIQNGDPALEFAAGALDLSITGAMSNYLAHALFDWILRGVAAPTFAASIYFSLHTGAPGQTGASECASSGNYSRAAVSRGTSSFSAPGTPGSTQNSNAITFGAPSGNWGLVTDFGIWDATSAGNFLFAGTMGDVNVNNGDAAPSFGASSITLTLA